ncbi:hypothetical protein K8R04_01830 [Candidatus Uhrbacteria bacterium]|nr:hypothetical protein [Candidatus Uhrbacteria bacterium]
MLFQFVFDGGNVAGKVLPSGTTNFGSVLGIVLLVIVVGLLAAIGIATMFRALSRPSLEGLDPKRLAAMWAEIEKTSEHGLMGAKLAVVEADKLLDTVLRKLHFPGETMGERLKTAAYKYPNISKVWGAHKLRNQLVHDATFEISLRQAKSAVRDFHAALKTLNVF